MLLAVFPGKEGRFRLYEDDGSSENYRQGEYEWTEITRACRAAPLGSEIGAVEGAAWLCEERGLEIPWKVPASRSHPGGRGRDQ